MLISLDTETTGVDFHHGSKPYCVTSCNEDGDITIWEWRVNPVTREPLVPADDVRDILNLIYDLAGDGPDLVIQNAKFDVAAFATIFPPHEWPWGRTIDTMMAAHLLMSNRPRNLTDLCTLFSIDEIKPYDKRLEVACKGARTLARSRYPKWNLAKEGNEDMPSAKGGDSTDKGEEKSSPWKLDGWLPKELWHRCADVRELHPEWKTVLAEYAKKDAEVTLLLWLAELRDIKRRGLEKHWEHRRKIVPIISDMEKRGVTILLNNLDELETEFGNDAESLASTCTEIAFSVGHDLTLPKGSGNNDSLLDLCFGEKDENKQRHGGGPLALPVVVRTEKGNPSLSKESLEIYSVTLDQESDQGRFCRALMAKRARTTALTYMHGYRRFIIPMMDGYGVIHPSINPAGTDTLRFSLRNPNTQNISKRGIKIRSDRWLCTKCDGTGEIEGKDCKVCEGDGYLPTNVRYCFGPAPNREWWSLDYKNLELRIPAYHSGEQELIELFERPDDPPYYGSNHILNFHTIHPEIWAEAEKEVGWDKVGPYCKKKYADTWYQWTKNGDFAIQYQAGHVTADAAFHKKGAHRILKSRFAKQEALNQRCIAFAERNKYIETLPSTEVDPTKGYPLLCTRTEHGQVLPTVPLSYMVQGTAGELTNSGMYRMEDQFVEWRKRDYYGFITMQVHDEIVADLPKRAHPSVDPRRSNLARVRVLQALMEQSGDFVGVPTPVGVEYHEHNWAEGISF